MLFASRRGAEGRDLTIDPNDIEHSNAEIGSGLSSHWLFLFPKTVDRVALGSVGVAISFWGFSLIGQGIIAGLILISWIVFVSPCILIANAWLSSNGNLDQRVRNCFRALFFWVGLIIFFGLSVAGLVADSEPPPGAELGATFLWSIFLSTCLLKVWAWSFTVLPSEI